MVYPSDKLSCFWEQDDSSWAGRDIMMRHDSGNVYNMVASLLTYSLQLEAQLKLELEHGSATDR